MTCDECGWIQLETGERFTDDILLRIYPVCVTTHKGTRVKLLMCHLVREMIESAAESWKHLYEKNNFCHPVTLAWFSIQILVVISKFSKLS